MIPIAIAVGLAVGRWWVTLVAAIGWGMILVATGVTGLDGSAVGGAALAAANAALGVAIHKCFIAVIHHARNAISN